MQTNQAYVDGEWIDAAQSFSVGNLGQVPDCGKPEFDRAARAASKAFEEWRIDPLKRADLLYKVYEECMGHVDELAKIIVAEIGKPLKESRIEIQYGASYFRWYSEEARRLNGVVFNTPLASTTGGTCVGAYIKQPIGVVGLMTPWNFPHAMLARKLAAALAAGCTAIIKPSKESPFSAMELVKICANVGIPKGVVNLLPCKSAKTMSDLMCNSPIVRGLSFTGSVRVGKELMAASAEPAIKRLSLELGGNAPFVVFASVLRNEGGMKRAVNACVDAKFRNAGQTCVACDRVFVHEDVEAEFVSQLQEAVGKLKVGDPAEEETDIGYLVQGRDSVLDLIKDAVAHGAEIVGGEPKLEGLHPKVLPPVLLRKCDPQRMKVCQEETFGPVLAICTFRTEEEVIRLCNDVEVGLASYICSSDLDEVMRVTARIDAGIVGVNQGLVSCAQAPFGGIKNSGFGREGSALGADEFLQVKYVCLGN